MFMEQPTIEVAIDYMALSFDQFTAVVTPKVEAESMGFLAVIYWLGVLFMLIKLALGIGKIFRMRYQADITMDGDQSIAYTSGDHAPFTFFGTIYLSKDRNDEDRDPEILTHEQAHVSGWHTLDVLFVEIVKAFFWFNPLVYGYDHALKTVHEYIADANVLQRTALQRYGRLLLRQAQPGLEIALANHFYNTQLKNRFKMMTRTPSQKRMLLKYLSVLPFILVVSLVFTNQQVQAEISKVEEIDLEELLNIDKIDPKDLVVRYANSNESDSWKKYAKINDDLHIMLTDLSESEKKELVDQLNNCSKEFNTDLVAQYIDNQFAIGFETGYGTGFLYPEQKITFNSNDSEFSFTASDSITYYNSKKEMHFFGDLTIGSGSTNSIALNTIDSSINKLFLKNIKTGKIRAIKEENNSKWGVVGDTIITYDSKTYEETIEVVISNRKTSAHNDSNHIETIHNINWNPTSKQPLIIAKSSKPFELEILDQSNNALYANRVYSNDWNGLDKNGKFIKDGTYSYLAKISKEHKIEGKLNISTTSLIDSIPTSNEVFNVVEEMPKYPGEKDALVKYIQNNLVYPKEAKSNNIEGAVLVEFVIAKDGQMKDIKTLRDPGHGTQQEALRMISKMAREIKWIPGKLKGEMVDVKMVLPIKFALSDNSDILEKVEEMPEYPGGQMALFNYIFKELKYPKAAQKAGIEGNAVIGFVVEKDGTMSNLSLERDPGAGLGQEALRVIDSMANSNILWKSGKQDGKSVRVQLKLPIKFKLESDKEDKQASDKNPLIVIFDDSGEVLFNLQGLSAGADAISPNDIKRINVLKDENATDKYGNEGMNGVIEIYMKPGTVKTPMQIKSKVKSTSQEMGFDSVKIYPNPASSELVIALEGIKESTSLVIHNIAGKVLIQKVLNSDASNSDLYTTHNIGELPNGVLVISLIQGSRVYSQPIVKK